MKCCPNCGWKPANKGSAGIRGGAADHLSDMINRFNAGASMQDIGDVYGITRERVRQLLKREGLTSKDGGKYKAHTLDRMETGRQKARAKRAKFIAKHGCSPEEFLAMNGGKKISDKSSYYAKFKSQEHNADLRGIGFHFTFTQWIAAWGEKLDKRGRTANSYVMARKMDTGDYEPGNVEIITMAENTRRYQKSLKERGIDCPDGHKRLPENPALLLPEGSLKPIQKKTHCLRGHPRTPENLTTQGACRICINNRRKRAREEQAK